MADVPAVATVEHGPPVAFFVLVEADDPPQHLAIPHFPCDVRRRFAYQYPMRTLLPVAAALLVLVARASPARAWGIEGHQITSLIAEAHLTPAAKAGIRDLLGKGPDGQQAEISDAEVCAWADRIRREPEGEGEGTGPYHYVDIPFEAVAYDPERDGNKGDNIIDKLVFYAEQLRDPSRPKAVREKALRWVVHLVGDLHQPLHCAERDHDRGGNARLAFLLDQKGKAGNLHAIWDGGILKLLMDKRPVAEVAADLNGKIKPAMLKQWPNGTPIDWANQSHDVAVKVVYAGVPADGPPPRLDEKYVARAKPAVAEQLQRGGIRLASILNKCFPARR